MIDLPIVDERFGRTGIMSCDTTVVPDERLDGGIVGLSPSFSTQEQASLKLRVNMVGSGLVLTNSFTWPAARK